MDTVARRRPKVSVGIGSDTIGATRVNLMKNRASGKSVTHHIKHPNMLLIVLKHAPSIGNVKPLFIWRKGKSIGAMKVICHD
jgi:hypothetical protein